MRITWPRIIIATLLFLAMVGAIVALAIIAGVNDDRADTWRDRSEELRSLVDERTRALNRQTTRLNTASRALATAKDSLARSEKDVAGLEKRQRELANEKAQLGDLKTQYEDAARRLQECRTSITTLWNTYATSEVGAPQAEIDMANQVCQRAEEAVPAE